MAKNSLIQKYGNSYALSQTYINKLNDFPTIKNSDGISLEKFSNLLTTCFNMSGNFSNLNQLNSISVICNLALKLPIYLQEMFRQFCNEIILSGRDPIFQDLVFFLYKNNHIALICQC